MNKKHFPVPFRIIGRHHGELIILRYYADHVTVSIGREQYRFPSYESALMFLQSITRKDRQKGGIV